MYRVHRLMIEEDTYALFYGFRLIAVGEFGEMDFLRQLFDSEFGVNNVQATSHSYTYVRIDNTQLPEDHAEYHSDFFDEGIAIYCYTRFVEYFPVDSHTSSGVFGTGVSEMLQNELDYLRHMIQMMAAQEKPKRRTRA